MLAYFSLRLAFALLFFCFLHISDVSTPSRNNRWDPVQSSSKVDIVFLRT